MQSSITPENGFWECQPEALPPAGAAQAATATTKNPHSGVTLDAASSKSPFSRNCPALLLTFLPAERHSIPELRLDLTGGNYFRPYVVLRGRHGAVQVLA
jgi:hypothetical protein